MTKDADRMPLTTTVKVLIVLGCLGGAYVVFFMVLMTFPNLVGPIIGDPAEPTVAITNACGETLLFSDTGHDPSNGTSAAWYAVEDGDTYSDAPGAAYSARVYGGLWTPGVMPNDELGTISGAHCPVEANPTQLATARAPMLANADVLSADVTAEAAVEGNSVGSEITTIVVRVTPEQAKTWKDEFAMAPSTGLADSPDPMLDAAVPGAVWYESDAFDSAILADGLMGYAYLDLDTGTVVARVRDDHSAS